MDDSLLLDTLLHLGPCRLLVLGDLMLDGYTWGQAARVSQEAPVLVLRADQHEYRLGGAANVAHMVAALEAGVVAAGVVGSDEPGRQVLAMLSSAGIDTQCVLTDTSRPTTFKERFLGRGGSSHASQILRVDREVCAELSREMRDLLIARLDAVLAECDAVLVADYAKGVCSSKLLEWLIARAAQLGRPVLVDPGPGHDWEHYRGATLIKPNRREAEAASGMAIPDAAAAERAGQLLCRRHGIGMTCITLDADGMVLAHSDGPGSTFPTQARAVYDITGAGDMVMAMLGRCMARRVPMDAAVQLANVAAGLEVEHNGVVPIPIDAIRTKLESSAWSSRPKIVDVAGAARLAEGYRRRGQRVVFTNGCFDLLHVGHVSYLHEAAELGDVLFVGVNGDAGVARLKGPQRPVIHESDRAAMLAALRCVDHVIIFDEDTPHALLAAIRPDVLVKGGTYRPDEVVGHEYVRGYGGEVVVTSMVDGVSTTRIIESMGERQGEVKRRAG